jgi:hypothetical protein
MRFKLRNVFLGFRDQLPLRRLIRNAWYGHLKGWMHQRSHYLHDGREKISYSSKETSLKAAKKMELKTGNVFRSYKCLYCDGYHIGKSRDKTLKHPDEDQWNGTANQDQ